MLWSREHTLRTDLDHGFWDECLPRPLQPHLSVPFPLQPACVPILSCQESCFLPTRGLQHSLKALAPTLTTQLHGLTVTLLYRLDPGHFSPQGRTRSRGYDRDRTVLWLPVCSSSCLVIWHAAAPKLVGLTGDAPFRLVFQP